MPDTSSAPRLAPPATVWFRAGAAVAIAAIALYGAACVYYVLGTTFGGHGESSVVCTAWAFREGAPLYPDMQAAPRYAMVYGPYSALAPAGLFWLAGPHLTVVRVAAGVFGLVGLLCCWRAYRRLGDPLAALLTTGWLALVYLKYTMITYYVRPDAALQLCMGLALLASISPRRRWAWLVLGLAIGWGIDLKITMPVYVLPLLVLFWQRHGGRALLQAAVLAGILAVLPFLLPQVSVRNYFLWLTTAVDEGTERTMIVPVAGYLALLSAPVLVAVVLLAWQQPATFKALVRRHRWFGLCSAVSFLVVLRITGKPGAGPSHLLPLFPILGLVLAKSLAALRTPAASRAGWKTFVMRAGGIVSLLVLIGFDVKAAVWDIFLAYPWAPGAQVMAEITNLAEHHPQPMAMGVGSSQTNYYLFRYQPVLVLRGNPYVLDIPAMMDMQKAGRSLPQATRDYMRQGTCPLWLIPREEAPFELRNWYEPRGMIFDDAFRAVFRDHYHVIDHSAHFDVWAYDDGAGRDPAHAMDQ